MLVGIFNATWAKMSGPHNSLKMGGNVGGGGPLRPSGRPSIKTFWGKSHMKLGADAQFVRFSVTTLARLFPLNDIWVDEKELKMQTKGPV